MGLLANQAADRKLSDLGIGAGASTDAAVSASFAVSRRLSCGPLRHQAGQYTSDERLQARPDRLWHGALEPQRTCIRFGLYPLVPGARDYI